MDAIETTVDIMKRLSEEDRRLIREYAERVMAAREAGTMVHIFTTDQLREVSIDEMWAEMRIG